MFKSDLGPLADRRSFLRYLLMLGVGGRVLLRSGDVAAAVDAADFSAEKHFARSSSNASPAPSNARNLSLAVTIATRAPAS